MPEGAVLDVERWHISTNLRQLSMDLFINCRIVYDIIYLETKIFDQNWSGLAVAEMQGHDYEPVVAIVLLNSLFKMLHFIKIPHPTICFFLL